MSTENVMALFDVGCQLLWRVERGGAFFIMDPYHECEIIALSAEGYYFNRDDDSDGEIELWEINKLWETNELWEINTLWERLNYERFYWRGDFKENCDDDLEFLS